MKTKIPTPAELKSLREAAEAASPGPWGVYGSVGQHVRTELNATEFRRIDINNKIDAAYIAAANPDTMLQLLDYISALETRVKRQEQALGILRDALNYFIERCEDRHPDGLILSQKTYTRFKFALSGADKILSGGEDKP